MADLSYPTEQMQTTAKGLRQLIEDNLQTHNLLVRDILNTAQTMPLNTLGAFQDDITRWNQSLLNTYEVMKILADQLENAANLMGSLEQDITHGLQPS